MADAERMSEPLEVVVRRVSEGWQISDRAALSFLTKLARLQAEWATLNDAMRVAKGEEYQRLSKAMSGVNSRISKLRTSYRYRNGRVNRACRAIRKAIREGKLTPKPCEICGEPRTQAHHEDYSKPLEVKWLCKNHHVEADEARRCREHESYRATLARRPVRKAIRQGKLIPKPCEICGEPITQFHHEYYSKPLEVKWLCKKHHPEGRGEMSITFSCQCGQLLRYSDQLAGRLVRCPRCGAVETVNLPVREAAAAKVQSSSEITNTKVIL